MKDDNVKKQNRKMKMSRTDICVTVLLTAAGLLLVILAGILLHDYTAGLKGKAYEVKDDVKALAACLAEQEADEAERAADKLEADLAALDAGLDTPFVRFAARSGVGRTELKAVRKASAIAKTALTDLARPYIALMRELPLSALQTEDAGFDLTAAERYLDFVEEKESELLRFSEELKEFGGMPAGMLENRLSDLKGETAVIAEIIPLSLDMTRQLLRPAVGLLRDHPLSRLETEDDGIDVGTIEYYLSFAEEKEAYVRALLEKLDALEPAGSEIGEKILRYRDRAESVLELYDATKKYQPLLRAFLGGGEDRLYVFAAQNSSEIRASGGFPGAVGTIRIRDGILKIEEFQPVNQVLSFYKTEDTVISPLESALFGSWFEAPRDADFCPDFERVAGIWASAYRAKNGEQVDGVLSATPVIIQRLLSAAGSVELSDGTVLDGSNAAKMLEYDMYYRFFGYGSDIQEGDRLSDELFAETAKKVMKKVMGQISAENIHAYLSVMKESADDRTLMLWLRDESEQELVRAAGLACSLNADPAEPETGVYFSLTNPSRMGWFLDMDPTLELLETHEDGSKTYAVHLEMKNVMTEQELRAASIYISGSGVRGTVTGFLYLFAPSGGTISEVRSSNGNLYFSPATYRDLALQYTHQIFIGPGDSVSFDYTVTTAACEQEELTFSMTPTLQEYR